MVKFIVAFVILCVYVCVCVCVYLCTYVILSLYVLYHRGTGKGCVNSFPYLSFVV